MAVPSRQIGWSQESNLLWEVTRQLERLTGVTSSISSLNGTSGTSGYSGDSYLTSSTDSFELGVSTTLTIGTGLAYSTAQDVLIAFDTDNHQVSAIVSYDPNTGVLVIGPPTVVTGSGTYSNWLVNLAGAAGGNGTSGVDGVPVAIGNTLTVDTVYGDDAAAALDPHSTPFKTINGALAVATAGELVIVNAGVYNETIVMPDNVSLQGTGAQSVIIQKLGVTANTTLITMGLNSRVENFTANLSSTGNFNLTGVEFPTGTSTNAKLRNSIWTITSAATGSPTIIGAKSSGTSATTYSAANAIQRTTLNVISSSTGVTRGILVDGPNRFAVRDIVVYARGTGTNIVGFETNHVSAVGEIKTSTMNGTLYDVNRTLGTLYIGSTDLFNNTANGNSFTPTQAPASIQYGTINDLGNNRRYYLIPGTVAAGTLIDEAKTNPYNPALGFPFPFTQPSLVIDLIITFTLVLGVGEAVTFNLYKNSSTTPVMTLTLNSGEGIVKTLNTESFSLSAGDLMYATLETTGDPSGTGAFSATVGYY